jgi:predicted alpha/beta-fold hydrolase
MLRAYSWAVLFAAISILPLQPALAEEAVSTGTTPVAPAPVVPPAVVPANVVTRTPAADPFADFDYSIYNGLYATVTAMQSFKKPEIKGERKFKLRNIDGFKKDVEVRALMQSQPAPLVVIFLGLATKSKDPLARLWQAQLWEAGNSVLVFDSVFRKSFNECSNHGVAGNVDAEARIAAKVIHEFIHHPEVEGKTTKLGLLGASYGGVLALNYARLAKDNVIRLPPDRVLVLSAILLDKYYDEDCRKCSFFDLLEMSGHKPVADGKKIPFSESQMRAGIGYVFHDDLDDAIGSSKNQYKYELPKQDGKQKQCFSRFIEQVVFPYWKDHAGVRSIEELWEFGNVEKLLNACGDNVHCIITNDDPLNDPTLLKFVQRDVPSSKLTVLPRGGHLGFLGTRWAKDRVQKMFE